MFSLICVWINGWVNNREAGDLRRRRAHYDVTVMLWRLTASTYALSNYCWTCCDETHMMTTSNRNIFRVTGPLWWVPTVTCGYPSQRPVTRSLMYSLMCAWTNCWTNNGAPGGLRRHDAHCDGHCNDLYFWMQKYHLFVSGVNMYTWYITMIRAGASTTRVLVLPMTINMNLLKTLYSSTTRVLISQYSYSCVQF